MPNNCAIQLVAMTWCDETTKHIEMNPDLAIALAGSVVVPLLDTLELAWALIANAHGGDWEQASAQWKQAAINWRDNHYHKILGCTPLEAK